METARLARPLAGLVGLTLIALALWRWQLEPRRRADRMDASAAGPIELRWRPPGRCIEVYAVEIDVGLEDSQATPARDTGALRERWLMALVGGREPGHARALLAPAPFDESSSPEPLRTRELWWSAKAVGPAAPDLACRVPSPDPLEAILAAAWPRLPAGAVFVGARWTGADVEGRCHESICVDGQGRALRSPEHPCRAAPMRERLLDYDSAPSWSRSPNWPRAVIESHWDDGHEGPKIGILTSRRAELGHGRPLRVTHTTHQRWAGLTREIRVVAIDDCDPATGTGRTLEGWPDLPRQIAAIRARLGAGPPALALPPAASRLDRD